MTIKQFAQEHGVSCQAVYQKLKKNGIKVDKLINHENPSGKRELSEDGINQLNNLFINQASTFNQVEQPVEQPEMVEELAAEVERLNARIRELETENARLTGKLEAQEKTVDTLTHFMDQQQQLHAMQIKALPGGGVRNWFSKLFKKGDGE